MAKDKKSFFERLTGSINVDEYEDESEDANSAPERSFNPITNREKATSNWLEEDTGEGELSVDVYQTPREIVIRTMVAGVRREDLDISITRDMVTIKGRRNEEPGISEQDYFHKELYWGAFSRTVLLPHEIEIEGAEAIENQGLLTVKLPKVDKERQAKLRVRAS
ncbi:MAG TPA: Hsp20 family protein [Candidatus Paceibacterota bacterium]|nr:Hsp20 family protein [Candidatus Paceibacterota bacterium]